MIQKRISGPPLPVDAQEQLGEVEGTSQLKRIAIIARDRKCYRRKIIKTQNGFSGRPCEKNRRVFPV